MGSVEVVIGSVERRRFEGAVVVFDGELVDSYVFSYGDIHTLTSLYRCPGGGYRIHSLGSVEGELSGHLTPTCDGRIRADVTWTAEEAAEQEPPFARALGVESGFAEADEGIVRLPQSDIRR